MAKKNRTPAPPKTVQAPKTRSSGGGAGSSLRGNGRWIAIGLVVVLIVVGLAVGGVLKFGSSGGTKASGSATGVPKAMAAAGCTFHTYPSIGRRHITTLNPNPPIKYNSFPPTSGPHYYIPAVWGSYDSPVSEYQAVHNLEHGGIVIQYGPGVSKASISQIADFYQSDPVALLVAPFPKLGNKISVTAWTHLAVCPSFDQKSFTAFRDAFRYQGPEKFPPADLQPGM